MKLKKLISQICALCLAAVLFGGCGGGNNVGSGGTSNTDADTTTESDVTGGGSEDTDSSDTGGDDSSSDEPGEKDILDGDMTTAAYSVAPSPATIDYADYKTYYFDYEAGKDNNSGLSEISPKKSLSELASLVKTVTAETPVRICLKRGATFYGNVILNGYEATEEKPLVIDAYGDEDDGYPIVYGTGSETAINAVIKINEGNIRIANLEVTGPTAYQGIYAVPARLGALKNVVVENCYVHDINFNWIYDTKPSETDPDDVDVAKVCPEYKSDGVSFGRYKYRQYGGIIFENNTTDFPSWFENIIVTGNRVENIGCVGLYIMNRWANRPGVGYGFNKYVDDTADHNDLSTGLGYYPHKNITFSYNVSDCIGKDALILSGVEDSFVEGNVSYRANYLGRVGYWNAAIWVFSARNVIFQYNEAAYTYMRHGSQDAQGFDIDNSCNNVYVRYNYSHHNEGGGILICNARTQIVRYNPDGSFVNGGEAEQIWGTWENNFIQNNVFAYNGRTDESTRSAFITVARTTNKLYASNNLVVLRGDIEGQSVINTEDASGICSDHIYANNIFYCASPVEAKLTISHMIDYTFHNNAYYNLGEDILATANDTAAITDLDPQIAAPQDCNGFDKVLAFAPSNASVFTRGVTLAWAIEKDIAGKAATGKNYLGAFCE